MRSMAEQNHSSRSGETEFFRGSMGEAAMRSPSAEKTAMDTRESRLLS